MAEPASGELGTCADRDDPHPWSPMCRDRQRVEPTVVEVVCDVWTVNAERRMFWRERNDKVQAARWAAKILAMSEKVPRLGRVSIEATPLQGPYGPDADPGAHEPVIKAVVDGLRDAGVLEDDTPEFVARIDSRPPERVKKGATGVRLILTPVALTD